MNEKAWLKRLCTPKSDQGKVYLYQYVQVWPKCLMFVFVKVCDWNAFVKCLSVCSSLTEYASLLEFQALMYIQLSFWLEDLCLCEVWHKKASVYVSLCLTERLKPTCAQAYAYACCSSNGLCLHISRFNWHPKKMLSKSERRVHLCSVRL